MRYPFFHKYVGSHNSSFEQWLFSLSVFIYDIKIKIIDIKNWVLRIVSNLIFDASKMNI